MISKRRCRVIYVCKYRSIYFTIEFSVSSLYTHITPSSYVVSPSFWMSSRVSQVYPPHTYGTHHMLKSLELRKSQHWKVNITYMIVHHMHLSITCLELMCFCINTIASDSFDTFRALTHFYFSFSLKYHFLFSCIHILLILFVKLGIYYYIIFLS